MIRPVTLVALLACGHSLFADEAVTQPQMVRNEVFRKEVSQLLERMLERIEDLEQRVSQLEAAAKQRTPDAPGSPPRQHHAPRYDPNPTPPSPSYPPYGTPHSRPPAPNTSPVPPARPDADVSKTWRPSYFNGQWYYIVPIDEAAGPVQRGER